MKIEIKASIEEMESIESIISVYNDSAVKHGQFILDVERKDCNNITITTVEDECVANFLEQIELYKWESLEYYIYNETTLDEAVENVRKITRAHR